MEGALMAWRWWRVALHGAFSVIVVVAALAWVQPADAQHAACLRSPLGPTEKPVGTDPRAIALGDFNNDGKVDFVTANAQSNNVSIRLGDGFGVFNPPPPAEGSVG